MARSRDADLIILGGGLAGLMLAGRLARSGARLAVRVIEPREHWTENRSWCFWAPRINPLAGLVTRRWERWSFSREGVPDIIHQMGGLSYQHLSSGAVFTRLLAAIEGAPDIRLETGVTAHTILPSPDGIAVETSAGRLTAGHVVDTRPPVDTGARGPLLFQCFAGQTVRLPANGIDEGCAQLMTGMRADAQGLRFEYVLPLGDGMARAEAVRWSFHSVGRETLAADLSGLLERRGWSGEGPVSYGVLPTGLPRERVPRMPGLARAPIGTGGWRAGAGHALLRTEAWAGASTARLLAGGAPRSHRDPHFLQHRLTRLVLRTWSRHPEHLDRSVYALACQLPPASLVRIMGGRAHFPDAVRLLACLDRRDLARAVRHPPAATA